MEFNPAHKDKFCLLHGGYLPCLVCRFQNDMDADEKREHEQKLKELEVSNQGGS